MTSAEGSLPLPSRKRSLAAALGSAVTSPRLRAYLAYTALALLISFLVGKDMNWDTLDYHFYAGFSALHDRLGMDYFPAGSQGYFNPYVYVPFYLLASSRLPALVDASILAILHSGILWLTYEIALQAAPAADGRNRIAIAVFSALFAFANPILLNLFGTSYADVITAELVLGGWLLLVRAVRAPNARCVVVAGMLLGAASALKLTNSVHALSAGVLLFFIPVRWPARARHMIAFGVALAMSFVLVCLPWSIRLEQHFGNPLFPLLNGIFRSPQFPTARMLDYRFIPDSFGEALWRPFAIATPEFMVDDEQQSPDLRYAVLLVAAILVILCWAWRRYRSARFRLAPAPAPNTSLGARPLAALGIGFGIDWILWLSASGNGRYFTAMACVAGVLGIALIYRLVGAPKIRRYLLVLLFGAQFVQLYMGTVYRTHIAWDDHPWFQVRMPTNAPRTPALYFSYGVQANAFIVPFLPSGSGFINVAGDYPLAAGGANGAAVSALIRRYSPHLRVLARDDHAQNKQLPIISGIPAAANALQPFGLSPIASDCATIEIPHEGPQNPVFVHTVLRGKPGHPAPPLPDRQVPASGTGYLTSCTVARSPLAYEEPKPGERRASLALDRLEDACPKLFQPARPVMQFYGDSHNEIWARRYLNTSLTAWVSRGWVQFVDPLRGGPATYVGREAAFEGKSVRIICGRRNERYFAKLVAPAGGGS
jgi:hypothetical protein